MKKNICILFAICLSVHMSLSHADQWNQGYGTDSTSGGNTHSGTIGGGSSGGNTHSGTIGGGSSGGNTYSGVIAGDSSGGNTYSGVIGHDDGGYHPGYGRWNRGYGPGYRPDYGHWNPGYGRDYWSSHKRHGHWHYSRSYYNGRFTWDYVPYETWSRTYSYRPRLSAYPRLDGNLILACAGPNQCDNFDIADEYCASLYNLDSYAKYVSIVKVNVPFALNSQTGYECRGNCDVFERIICS